MNKKLVLGIIIVVISISLIVLIQNTSQTNQSENFEKTMTLDKTEKAAIIDQIHDSIPNIDFQNQATEYLELAGYEVDLYTTKDIDVDFYKKLPSMKYNFIVIRTHGTQDENNNNATMLFTGEIYDDSKHVLEQLSDQVGRGAPLLLDSLPSDAKELESLYESISDQVFFTVGSKLVDDLMVDTFPDSVILIGGCQTIENHDLAISLMKRGAKKVIGWNGSITASDNDQIILEFLEMVLIKNEDMKESARQLYFKHSPTMAYPSKLVVGSR